MQRKPASLPSQEALVLFTWHLPIGKQLKTKKQRKETSEPSEPSLVGELDHVTSPGVSLLAWLSSPETLTGLGVQSTAEQQT